MNPMTVSALHPLHTPSQRVALVAMQLAEGRGVWCECMARSCIPSLEEVEAQLGRDLLQEAREVVVVNDANHGAAGLALNKRVLELRPVDPVSRRGL